MPCAPTFTPNTQSGRRLVPCDVRDSLQERSSWNGTHELDLQPNFGWVVRNWLTSLSGFSHHSDALAERVALPVPYNSLYFLLDVSRLGPNMDHQSWRPKPKHVIMRGQAPEKPENGTPPGQQPAKFCGSTTTRSVDTKKVRFARPLVAGHAGR